MGKTKETKEKPKKGFSSRSASSTTKEQGSAMASGKSDPPGEASCGHDDGSARKSVSSSEGDPKRRGLPASGGSHGTPGEKVESSNFLSAQSSTPIDSHQGESDARKYGGQVTTRPPTHVIKACLSGVDRNSEVPPLSSASPQVDYNPISGFPLPDKSLRDNRSTSPGERSVQKLVGPPALTGPNRTSATEHRSAHDAPDTTSLVRYRLSTFSHRTGPNRTEPDRTGLKVLLPRHYKPCLVPTVRKHKFWRSLM